MTWPRAAAWIAGFAALAAAGLSCGGTRDGAGPSVEQGRVVRVVDGDTIVVRTAARTTKVRYIGVDTPETVKPDTPVQCYGEAAHRRNDALVAGRDVVLRFDAERQDRYGRLLAYVYRRADGLFVNAALLRGGYARTLEIAPNTRHLGEFRALAAGARHDARGLWAACPAGG